MEKKKKTESKITEKKTIKTSQLGSQRKKKIKLNKTKTEWKPNHLQTTFP